MMSLANERSALRNVAIVMLVVTTITGCSTMQRVPTPNATIVSSEVEVGDRVEITRINGRKLKFKVTQISPSGVTGKNSFVAYADMRALSVRKAGHGDALKQIAGIVGIVLLTNTLLKGLSAVGGLQ